MHHDPLSSFLEGEFFFAAHIGPIIRRTREERYLLRRRRRRPSVGPRSFPYYIYMRSHTSAHRRRSEARQARAGTGDFFGARLKTSSAQIFFFRQRRALCRTFLFVQRERRRTGPDRRQVLFARRANVALCANSPPTKTTTKSKYSPPSHGGPAAAVYEQPL